MTAQLYRYKCGCIGTAKDSENKAVIISTCDSSSYVIDKRTVEGGQPLLFEGEEEAIEKINTAIGQLEEDSRFLQEIRKSIGVLSRLFRSSSYTS